MQSNLKHSIFAALLAVAAGPASAELSEVEQRIVERVKARSTQAIDFLERTVRVNSGTMNHEGVREAGALFAAELDTLGFKTRWAEMPKEMQRAGHLVATREGRQGQRVLLMGHLDTVFEKQSPTQLWDRRGTKVRGQGVVDMKGGNVVVVEALRALHGLGLLDDTAITVVFTGDEERVGNPRSVARRDLVDAAKRSDVALSFEGSTRLRSGHDLANIARRGSGGFALEITAQPGHSAGIASGRSGSFGAIFEGARILNAFREQVAEPGLTFSPGIALGGTAVDFDEDRSAATVFGKTNVIPRVFVIHSDLRYLDAAQLARAKEKMAAIVAQNLAGTNARITFREGYPPMTATPGNQRLLEFYSRVSEDAGFGPVAAVEAAARGASDVQFVAPFVDCLDGIGPWGSGAHTVSEEIDLPSLERSAIRAALAIYRLTRHSPGSAPR